MPSEMQPASKPLRITFAKVKAKGAYISKPAYTIKVNGVIVGRIQQITSGQDSWFWYTSGRNTASTPTTFEQAMLQSAKHLRSLSATNTAAVSPA